MNKISQTVPLQYDTIFSPFGADEFDTALHFLAEKGFTGVELAVAYPRRVDTENLLKKLEDVKLAVTTLSTGQICGLDGLFLSSFDAEIRAGAVEVVKGHIELSARIGFPPVTIGLLRGQLEQGEKEALMQNLRQALRPCVEYAQKHGVTLQIEPIRKEETVLINNTMEALEFIGSLGWPEHVGILYDCFHSNLEDEDMVRAIRMAGKRITNVHLADSNRGLPGQGHIDFPAIHRALQEVDYCGAYALETLVVPDREFINRRCYDSVLAVIGESVS